MCIVDRDSSTISEDEYAQIRRELQVSERWYRRLVIGYLVSLLSLGLPFPWPVVWVFVVLPVAITIGVKYDPGSPQSERQWRLHRDEIHSITQSDQVYSLEYLGEPGEFPFVQALTHRSVLRYPLTSKQMAGW
jgi:hypothetical protein